MAYFGAGGATQEEIKKTLGYDGLSIADIAAYQKYLLETYAKTGDTTFYSVNSMWIDDEINVKSAYTDTMINNFDAEVENIDLQGENAVKTLNSWIDRKTKGMITKLFERPFAILMGILCWALPKLCLNNTISLPPVVFVRVRNLSVKDRFTPTIGTVTKYHDVRSNYFGSKGLNKLLKGTC